MAKAKINYTKLTRIAREAIRNPAKDDLTKIQLDLGSWEYCIQTIRVQASVDPDVPALQEIIRLATMAIALQENNDAN